MVSSARSQRAPLAAPSTFPPLTGRVSGAHWKLRRAACRERTGQAARGKVKFDVEGQTQWRSGPHTEVPRAPSSTRAYMPLPACGACGERAARTCANRAHAQAHAILIGVLAPDQKVPPVRHPESPPSPSPPRLPEPPASARSPPHGVGQDGVPRPPPKSGSARGAGKR